MNFYLPPLPVVYATDRSKAVVPVLFFVVSSWFKVFPCSLSSCFAIPFSILITALEEDGASRVFVCLFCTSLVFVIFPFLLVSGVGCGL